MRIKLGKLLLRFVGFELLAREFAKILVHSLGGLQGRLEKMLWPVLMKLGALLGLAWVACIGVLFALMALAQYLNGRFGGAYQGFVVVAAACAGMIALSVLVVCLRRILRK